nr:L-lactate permease [Brachybacterium faecium]
MPDLEATARVPRGRRGLRRGSLPFRAGGDRSLEPVLHPDRVHPRVLVAPVKELFTTGVLSFTTLAVPIPGLFGSVTSASGDVVTATWTFSALGATGTAILLAVRVSFLTSPQLSARRLLRELGATIGELWKAIARISIILVLANIANYAAATSSMGSALAATGALFPLIAPVIGWIGVFLTGSVVNYNTLFAPLQVATAEGIGSDPALFVGANTAGGNAAKVISPQSIAIAAGAVGLSGRESDILRASILYSLGILAVICVWNLVLSLVLT